MPAQLGETPLKPVSLRLDPDRLKLFEKVMSAAGLSTAEATRQAMDNVVEEFDKVDVSGIRVEWEFTPKSTEPTKHPFPELVGHLRLRVTPPPAVTVDRMHQLVYVLPEFFDAADREPFRVDNAHFHRIGVLKKVVDSKKPRSRASLSFRLIQGQWSGSLFDYSGAGAEHIKKEVVDAMTAHFSAAFKCDLIRQLPPSRILTHAELDEYNEFLLPYLIREWPATGTSG